MIQTLTAPATARGTAARASDERHNRKAAERERDAHRQHAIEMERGRDAANERAERAERALAEAHQCAAILDDIANADAGLR